jgi:hypothetical protein
MEPALSETTRPAFGDEPSLSGEHRRAEIAKIARRFMDSRDNALRDREARRADAHERYQRDVYDVEAYFADRYSEITYKAHRDLSDLGLSVDEIAEALSGDDAAAV